VSPGTYNIDVDQIEALIGPKTRALMVPNLIGNVPDWDRVRQIADRHGLAVIEDSADTLGAILRGRSTGERSDISTTSFYGSHVINAAGNGGMLCVGSEAVANRARLLRSWGRASSVFVDSENISNRFDVELDGIRYDAKFVFAELGYNFEPSELGAAFGLVQLGKLAHNVAMRERWVAAHSQFFRAYEEWFLLPRQQPESRTAWLAYALTVRDEAPFSRNDLQIHFEKHGIQTRPVFTGNVLRQPGFKRIVARRARAGYPVADQVMRGGMLFACHHGLEQAHVERIHEVFRDFAKRL
jgi:CDP-6-deoxy-D-xylo-4-hexulose-3-dehydrase